MLGYEHVHEGQAYLPVVPAVIGQGRNAGSDHG